MVSTLQLLESSRQFLIYSPLIYYMQTTVSSLFFLPIPSSLSPLSLRSIPPYFPFRIGHAFQLYQANMEYQISIIPGTSPRGPQWLTEPLLQIRELTWVWRRSFECMLWWCSLLFLWDSRSKACLWLFCLHLESFHPTGLPHLAVGISTGGFYLDIFSAIDNMLLKGMAAYLPLPSLLFQGVATKWMTLLC